jgi:SNF2 family DNA or RNA helicase
MNFKSFLKQADLQEKSHQVEGVDWILKRESNQYDTNSNIKGGIIADEMGLGKTIQLIGAMVSNKKKHTLIVVPLCLMNQWYREIGRTTGHRCLIYHGTIKKQYTINLLKEKTIVITSYGTFKHKKSILNQIEWDRTIFDEAHHLRNFNQFEESSLQKVTSLKSNIIWLITGTPIQNKRRDISNLFRILGYPLSYISSNLKMLINQQLLRRTKASVGIKLPLLTVEECIVNWDTKEENALANKVQGSIFGSSMPFEQKYSRFLDDDLLITKFLRAKQNCIMPKMLNKQLEESELDPIQSSLKLSKVLTKMEEFSNSPKIVFSNFHMEIDFLYEECQKRNWTVAKVDGRTSSSNRKTIFADSYQVLLLHIISGCEGLNLQQYTHMFFTSPHWNPSLEDQAIARAHRIGQSNPVKVFHFKMEKEKIPNIETFIGEKQKDKKELARQYLD